MDKCYLNFKNLLQPYGDKIVFLCIGTDRSTGDSLGPIIGTELVKRGYNVAGSIHYPVTALNLEETNDLISEKYPDHLVVAIDACLGNKDRIGNIVIQDRPIEPGKALDKDLPLVGDISIYGVVGMAGFMEYAVLNNTRLSLIYQMSDIISDMIYQCVPVPEVNIGRVVESEPMPEVTMKVRRSGRKPIGKLIRDLCLQSKETI